MRKLLNNPWLVSALALAALALVVFSFRSPRPLSTGPESPLASGTVADEAAEPAAVTDLPPTSIRGALKELPVAATLRDPFAARVTNVDQSVLTPQLPDPDVITTVHLSAIWTQGGVTLVLINERICQSGDELSPFKIEAASQDGVWLTHAKGRDFVELGHDFTLVTPGKTASTRATL